MLFTLNEVKTYTFQEFREIQENRELRVMDELSCLDRAVAHLKRNKNKYLKLVIILALVLPATTLQVFAESEIINTGVFFYQYIKDVAYVICLLGGAVEGMKCVLSGTTESIGKVGIKYLAFALIVKFLPKVVGTIFAM